MWIRGFIRPALGMVLILASLAGFWWWESYGREKMVYQEVLVAGRNIRAGEELSPGDFKIVHGTRETMVRGGISPREIKALKGKEASIDIGKGSQITSSMLRDEEDVFSEGKSIYVLGADWIESRSSSLRKGDVVEVYTAEGDYSFGRYPVIYVRDQDEQEVTGGKNEGAEGIESRNYSSGQVGSVEVCCRHEDYQAMSSHVKNEDGRLLLVQREAGGL